MTQKPTKAPSKSRSVVGLPQCYLPLRSTGEIAGETARVHHAYSGRPVPVRSHRERLRHRNGRCRAVHILATKENCLMQDLPAETTRDLFTPIEVGPLTLPNRIVMAPLTRSRAGPGN